MSCGLVLVVWGDAPKPVLNTQQHTQHKSATSRSDQARLVESQRGAARCLSSASESPITPPPALDKIAAGEKYAC